MNGDLRLPIKVVLPQKQDFKKTDAGGGPRKVFGKMTAASIKAVVDKLQSVNCFFTSAFKKYPGVPAVARVTLKEEAIAKSHRPTGLFNTRTCPIIGVRNFGELFVSVQPEGLERLMRQIEMGSTKTDLANISTIHEIEPYSLADVFGRSGIQAIQKYIENGHQVLKLRLFQHRLPHLNTALFQVLIKIFQELNLPDPEEIRYASNLSIFRIRNVRSEMIEPLGKFIGTQNLSVFPAYGLFQSAARVVKPVVLGAFPPPDPAREYPVIGIVDSGVNPDDPVINHWVVDRRSYVPDAFRDHIHGTFVAGLAVYARKLNHNDPRFPDSQVKLVDVLAVPRGGKISEDQLLSILEEVLPNHPDVRIWNISLSSDTPCEDGTFSDMTTAFDELQNKYGVTFVFSAGNFSPPLRNWPPNNLGEHDRICPPSDSVRGISVGSLAHLDSPQTLVRKEEPAPFSRRGPGPAFITKPDITHYGGNCDAHAGFVQTGVLSFNGLGLITENAGTSFSTPIVSSLLANIESILTKPVSRNLSKALLIHSAVLNNARLTSQDLKYRGFGIPGDITRIMTCTPWEATLLFEPNLMARFEYEKRRFPIPPALRKASGLVFGEFAMTLVYDPPLNPAYGAEYCRTNVEVSLGTYDLDEKGDRHHARKIPPEPADVNLLYERHLIEHGFKWSPVKVYRRSIPNGVSGNEWRLLVSVHHRSGYVTTVPQGMVLLLTMWDPDKRAPVYDQMVTLVNRLGWSTENLKIREQERTRLRI